MTFDESLREIGCASQPGKRVPWDGAGAWYIAHNHIGSEGAIEESCDQSLAVSQGQFVDFRVNILYILLSKNMSR